MGLFAKEDVEVFHGGPESPGVAGEEAVRRLGPRLTPLARRLADRLARVQGVFLFPALAGRPPGQPPQEGVPPRVVELLAAVSRSRGGIAGKAILAVGISHAGVHAHVVVPPGSEDARRMGGALRESALRLARHHGSFGVLRCYSGWDGVGLPEVATTRAPAFWDTLGLRLAESAGWLDLGTAWGVSDLPALELDDLVRSLQRLFPLYRMATEEGYRPILR